MFIYDLSFFKQHFRCSPDEMLRKAGFHCTFFNNSMPLAIGMGLFLLSYVLMKYVIIYFLKPTLSIEQRKQILKIKKNRVKNGMRESIDSADLLKNMPSLLETERIKIINGGLFWITTHRFWFYLIDYLLVDIFFIVLVSLKHTIQLGTYGKVIGKVDILLNIIAIYLLFKFFKWKTKLIRDMKNLAVEMSQIKKSARSSAGRSLSKTEIEVQKHRQSKEKFLYKWLFVLEEFSYKFKPRPVQSMK